jgi:hypothetical protein
MRKGGIQMSTVYPGTPKTAKPVVAGIFNIMIGSACMLGVLGLGIAMAVVGPIVTDVGMPVFTVLAIIAFPLAVIGIISIVGGIFELQRRMWGMALAGSIAATCVSQMFGVASIVLTAVSKDEFGK